MSSTPSPCSALITGGSGGIGRAIARMLLLRGYGVTILGSRQASVHQALEELRSHGGRLHGVPCDVTDQHAIQGAFASHLDKFEGLDVLINAAGILGNGPLERHSAGDIDRVLAIDLGATVHACRLGMDALRAAARQRGSALIVNIASISGKRADAGFSVYCAAKFGVVGFTAALALELSDDGVAACAVCPGLVDTDMAFWARDWASPATMLTADDVADAIATRLLERRPQDVPHDLVLQAPGFA